MVRTRDQPKPGCGKLVEKPAFPWLRRTIEARRFGHVLIPAAASDAIRSRLTGDRTPVPGRGSRLDHLGGRLGDAGDALCRPSDAVAARFSLILNRLGTVRTKTLKAFPEAAYREIVASLA
jgi:hypothetical protein